MAKWESVLTRLRLVWSLAQTAAGRREIVDGIYFLRAWPLMARLARLQRATLARRTRIITVVGSFGKTTTTRMVSQALGLPLPARPGSNGRSTLAEGMLRIRPGQRHAVFEVGISRRGLMTSYASMMRPNAVVVTAIGSDHEKSFGTLEVTRHEKAEMVRALPPTGLAVLNGDDPHVRWMAGQTRARVVTFGFGDDNDVQASDFAIDWPHGSRFRLRIGGEQREVRARLLGRHQVHSILAAVTVAHEEGFVLDSVLARLEQVVPPPRRLELVPLENGAFLLRDENKSSFETFEAALDTLGQIPAARRIAVLGGINYLQGSQGPLYRQLGERVAQVASRVVVTGTRKMYQHYSSGARGAGLPPEAVTFVGSDLLHATDVIRADLQPGDVVLVKGQGLQRLARISLALAGRTVRCTLVHCDLWSQVCDTCPMLERGWHTKEASILRQQTIDREQHNAASM